MKIGVISDTHDRTQTTGQAIAILLQQGAETLIHCGDIFSPETVAIFASVPTHFVVGNWDDAEILAPAIDAIGGKLHGTIGELTLAGKKIGWCHSHVPGQLRRLEESHDYEFVFYGHSHVAEQHRNGPTTVANPGALQRAKIKTCLLVDLAKSELRSIEVSRKPG